MLTTDTNLVDQSSLCAEAVLQEEGALVSCHTVEEDSQHTTQNTLLQLWHNHRLMQKHTQTLMNYVKMTHVVTHGICSKCIQMSHKVCYTLTMISSVSRAMRAASVAKFPSTTDSCSTSALVLHRDSVYSKLFIVPIWHTHTHNCMCSQWLCASLNWQAARATSFRCAVKVNSNKKIFSERRGKKTHLSTRSAFCLQWVTFFLQRTFSWPP